MLARFDDSDPKPVPRCVALCISSVILMFVIRSRPLRANDWTSELHLYRSMHGGLLLQRWYTNSVFSACVLLHLCLFVQAPAAPRRTLVKRAATAQQGSRRRRARASARLATGTLLNSYAIRLPIRNRCSAGSSSPTQNSCPAGSYGNPGATSAACSGQCAANYWCGVASTSQTQNACPANSQV